MNNTYLVTPSRGEPVTGIEPVSLVYKTSALPLCYTDVKTPLAKTGETGRFSESQSRCGESNSDSVFTRDTANHWHRHVERELGGAA
jgi:hypothetical protein